MIALATEQLSAGGYRVVRDLGLGAIPGERGLIAEDDYSVLAVVGYESWAQLSAEWEEAQNQLVDLLGRRLARSAPKAWDGYLLLLCTSVEGSPGAAAQIERDTTRVRKIVATAETLKTTADISRILEMFLPLNLPDEFTALTDILSTLPEVMAETVPSEAVRAVVHAFRLLEPRWNVFTL